jgi:hypothetical protein
MTINETVNFEKLDWLLDKSLFFYTTEDQKRLQLKDYYTTFRNYIKNPYSSYKMFKLLPLEVSFYLQTLDLFKDNYKEDPEMFETLKNLAKKLIEKSNEILELIENNAL